MGTTFTPKQGQYLACIRAYSLLVGSPPSEADLARFFDVAASAVHKNIVGLEEAGLIRRSQNKARSIEVLVPNADIPALEISGMKKGKVTAPKVGKVSKELVDPLELITLQQASTEFGYSRQNLRLLAVSGKLKAWLVGTWLTTREHMRDYIENDPDRRHPRRSKK